MFDEDSDLERKRNAAEDSSDPLNRFLRGNRNESATQPLSAEHSGAHPATVQRASERREAPMVDPGRAAVGPSAVGRPSATGLQTQIEVHRDGAVRIDAKDARYSYSERLEEIYSSIAELRTQLDQRIEIIVDGFRESAQALDERIADSGLAVRDRLDDIYARSSTQEELLDALRSPGLGGGDEFAQLLGTIEQGQQKLRKFVAETTSASDIAFQQFTVAFEDFAKELHEAFTQLDEQVEELAIRPANDVDLSPITHAIEQCTAKLRFLDEAVSRLQVTFIEKSFDHKNSLTLGFSILLFMCMVQIGLLAWLAIVG